MRGILNLEGRLRAVEARTRGIPSRFAGGGGAAPTPAPEVWLQCIGGNTLTSGQDGVKGLTANLAAQTAACDPYGTAALADGLGRAYIWRNGVQGLIDRGAGPVAERVLVVIDPRSRYRFAWVVSEWALAWTLISIGTATVSATWTRSGTTATVTATGHGLLTGGEATVTVTSDADAIPLGAKSVTVTGANTFTIPCLDDGATSGSLTYTAPLVAYTLATV